MAEKVKKLLLEKENVWKRWKESDKKKSFRFAGDYKDFLNECKTEFEFTEFAVKYLEKNGYISYEKIKNNRKIKFPLKVYFNNRNATLAAFYLKKDFYKEGLNLIFSHIDSPRIDVRQNSLREDFDISYFKTIYYGGIKRYQWANIPLALHGKIATKDGKIIKINIGENESDPVFIIADLLPHIRGPQTDRKSRDVFKGEELDVLAGSMPISSNDKDIKQRVKAYTLEILNKRFGIKEVDLFTADLQFVPALKARDAGLDGSMIAAYGHDDRICAYTSLKALLDTKNANKSFGVYWLDKEEIGSTGNTGAKSRFVENCILRLLAIFYDKNLEFMKVELIENSLAISADVGVAITPNFSSVFDTKGDPMLGYGTIVSKVVGGAGKGGSNEANAEFTSRIVSLFNEKKVPWQIGGFGKIDLSGGGTVATYIAQLNMDVIDVGPGVISMHSPYEIISKADLYSTYLAYHAFLNW